MNAVREAWTDERLDDLNDRVDHGFARVDLRFEQIDQRLEQLDQRLGLVETDLRELRATIEGRFDRLQLGMITFAGAISAAVIASPHL